MKHTGSFLPLPCCQPLSSPLQSSSLATQPCLELLPNPSQKDQPTRSRIPVASKPQWHIPHCHQRVEEGYQQHLPYSTRTSLSTHPALNLWSHPFSSDHLALHRTSQGDQEQQEMFLPSPHYYQCSSQLGVALELPLLAQPEYSFHGIEQAQPRNSKGGDVHQSHETLQ